MAKSRSRLFADLIGVSNIFDDNRTNVRAAAVVDQNTGLTLRATTANTMSVANTQALVNARLGATATVALTGDITASATAFSANALSITTDIASTGTPTGTFGSGSLVPVITVGADGRITNISNTTVAGVSSTSWTVANNNLRIATADGSTFDTTIGSFMSVANTQTLHSSITANLNSYVANTNSKINQIESNLLSTNTSIRSAISTEVSNLVDSAPSTLNTLNELAAALGDDANFATTTATNIGQKLGATASITLTGAITGSGSFSSNAVSITTSSGTGINAATLDSLDSTQFLRSDAADTKTSGDLSFSDNVKAVFGTGSDLQIYHTGSESFIKDAGTGNLRLQGTDVQIRGGSTAILADFVDGGAVTLRHNNSEKFSTTSGGIDVTGTITFDGGTTSADLNFGDNDKAVFGAGSDLEIYHDGSHSWIKDTGTGYLILKGTDPGVAIQNNTGNNLLLATNNYVELAYGTGVVLTTVNGGISVSGNIGVSGTVDGRDVASDGSKLDGIESGATADQSASEILTLIKTVDGSGSGLDADLLDGQNGGYYTSRISTVDGLTSSDNLNSLGSNYGWYKWASSVPSNAPTSYGMMLYLEDNSQPQQLVQTYGGATNKVRLFGRRQTGGVWDTSWTEYWSDKNDGSGSGLDADTVDGLQASQFLRSDTSDTTTGNLTINGDLVVDEIRVRSGQDLTITAGESHTAMTDATFNDEIIRLAGEGGVKVYASSDNLTSGLNKVTTLIDTNGDMTVSGSVTTEGPDGGGFIGYWPNSSAYVMFGTANMTGQEYSVLTNGLDTFIGAGSGGSTHIRGPANDSAPQIKVTSSTVLFENGPVEIIDNTGLFIKTPTNGAGADIKFSDAQSGNYNQVGTLSYRHTDGAVTTVGGNSNDGFIFSGTETRTVVKVEGDIVATGAIYGDGSSLTGIAAGATGGGSDEIFWENGQTVTSNYTITNGKNAMSAGPITINTGVTVTVGTGETWTVV